MGRPRTITDQQITDTARALVLDHGPGVSTQLIAQALGVSQAALFKRFGTKEKLLLAALQPGDPGALGWFGRLRAGPAARPAVRQQLTRLAVEMDGYFGRLVPGLVMLRASGLPLARVMKGGPPPVVMMQAALAAWLLQARVARGAPAAAGVAAALVAGIEARCLREYLLGSEFVPDARSNARALLRTLWPAKLRPPARRGGPRRSRL